MNARRPHRGTSRIPDRETTGRSDLEAQAIIRMRLGHRLHRASAGDMRAALSAGSGPAASACAVSADDGWDTSGWPGFSGSACAASSLSTAVTWLSWARTRSRPFVPPPRRRHSKEARAARKVTPSGAGIAGGPDLVNRRNPGPRRRGRAVAHYSADRTVVPPPRCHAFRPPRPATDPGHRHRPEPPVVQPRT